MLPDGGTTRSRGHQRGSALVRAGQFDRATHPTLDGRLNGFCVGCPVLISVFG
jgi:hypothetical protein